jgi:hypothetical protein
MNLYNEHRIQTFLVVNQMVSLQFLFLFSYLVILQQSPHSALDLILFCAALHFGTLEHLCRTFRTHRSNK